MMRAALLWTGLGALLAGCAGEEPAPLDTGACAYPDAPSEMTPDEPLPAYAWPEALHADGRSGALDLEGVPCPDLGDIDWSAFDVLLFVSVPAW